MKGHISLKKDRRRFVTNNRMCRNTMKLRANLPFFLDVLHVSRHPQEIVLSSLCR